MQNVGRNRLTGRFERLSAFWRLRRNEFLMAVVIFTIGFLTAYSAGAAEAPPSQADWDAWSKLGPVKKFDYDKVYNDIDSDIAKVSVHEEQYAQNLPMQLSGPMHAIAKNRNYRGNSRIK